MPAAYQWQWQSAAYTTGTAPAWTNIAGASNTGASPNSFTVAAAQAGRMMRVLLTYTDQGGTARADRLVLLFAGLHRCGRRNHRQQRQRHHHRHQRQRHAARRRRRRHHGRRRGNDRYAVDHPGDEVVEAAGGGTDTVYSTVTYILPDNVETLILLGATPSTAPATPSTTRFRRQHAANALSGGAGNDTYFIGAGDTVVEQRGEGTDTVSTYVDFTLPDNVENLTFNASGSATRVTGNDAEQRAHRFHRRRPARGRPATTPSTAGSATTLSMVATASTPAALSGTRAEHVVARTGDNDLYRHEDRHGRGRYPPNVEFAQFSGPPSR